MIIESIKLEGFKSFRNQTKLSFPGQITAVVGPNGVGKSNIADAFRWVLGEQKLKNLRSKESIDVIFAGSNQKSQLSRAVVTVKFNLKAGKKEKKEALKEQKKELEFLSPGIKNLLDLSEIEIKRKIYRNGESSYLINSQESRLLDIRLFLAAQNVGQKNYAVIGQGMVDRILKISPQERIDFFYEATGVKKYQIKLHKSSLKLKRAQERLNQTRVLLKEITPHKNYLSKQAEKFKQKKEILDRLYLKQKVYYSQAFCKIRKNYLSKKQNFVQIEKQKEQSSKEIIQLKQQIERITEKANFGPGNLTWDLKKLYQQKQHLKEKISSLNLQKQQNLEKQQDFDTAFLYRRQKEVKGLLESLISELEELKQSIKILKERQERSLDQVKNLKKLVAQKKNKQIVDLKNISQELEKCLRLTKLSKLKKAIKSLLAKIKEPSEQVFNWNQEIKELNTVKASTELKLELAKQKQQIFKKNRSQYQEELDSLELKLKKQKNGQNRDYLVDIEKKEENYQSKLKNLEKDILALEDQIKESEQEKQKNQQKVKALQKDYNQALEQQEHLTEMWQAIKIDLARLEFQKEQVCQEIKQELGNEFLKKIAKNSKDFINKQKSTVKKSQLNQLRKQADCLGQIEGSILQEYNEVKKRFDFLSEQSQDLKSAISSLRKISRNLEQRIKKDFQEKFKVLNKQFAKYFKILFSGGSAVLKQVEVGDSKDLGIEIQAHPPSKKIKHVLSLSGGERSLVALSLICAIISSNPPPFVILDEIDAALDEANSMRLGKIFQKISLDTQLIVITHNRSTMEIADVLYGVSMNDSGVSNIVGVKLDGYEKEKSD